MPKDCGAQILPETIFVVDEKQLTALNDILTADNIQALKDNAKLCFCSEFGTFLPDSYSSYRNKYHGSTEGILKDHYAKSEIKEIFGTELGVLYAERYGDEAKNNILRSFARICVHPTTSL